MKNTTSLSDRGCSRDRSSPEREQSRVKRGSAGGTLHQAVETTAGTWTLVSGEVSSSRDSLEWRGGGIWDGLYLQGLLWLPC